MSVVQTSPMPARRPTPDVLAWTASALSRWTTRFRTALSVPEDRLSAAAISGFESPSFGGGVLTLQNELAAESALISPIDTHAPVAAMPD